MNSNSPQANTPLLRGISQFEVDFVIPRIGVDLPMGIDPFLLFKSRDSELFDLHSTILQTFGRGIELLRRGKLSEVRHLFDFPEASEIGFGYTQKSKRGAGVGTYLSELIIETLNDSPALAERGIRHIEELQLVSVGIGPDRISDISANLIKQFLINYTQRQCEMWKLPLSRHVPVNHIFDPESGTWHDGYFDLPRSPLDDSPILLVPRRIVRTLPWINYDEFFRLEFSSYLRAKRVKQRLGDSRNATAKFKVDESKRKVVEISRAEVHRVDSYVGKKEAAAANAQPTLSYLDLKGTCAEAENLKKKLRNLNTGIDDATEYQFLTLEILNFLFNPELIDGEPEVRTIDGTERRDILFTNDSDRTFWTYLRTEHSAIILMFETKNTKTVTNIHLNQTSTYLGDRIGRVGFIVTRSPLREAQERKAFSIYNDSTPRKIILVLSDHDIDTMLDMKCSGDDPMRYVQRLYRAFRTSVQ